MKRSQFTIVDNLEELNKLLATNDVHQVTSHVYTETVYSGFSNKQYSKVSREWHVWYKTEKLGPGLSPITPVKGVNTDE